MSILKMKIPNTFYDWLCKVSIGRLPRHYKRSLFISSVYGLIKETKDPNTVNLEKLNRLLSMDCSREGITKSLRVTSLIWHNLEPHSVVPCTSGNFYLHDLSESQKIEGFKVDAAVNMIFNNIPTWLSYGTEKLMKHDLYVLINNINRVQTQPAT